jgi:hypothetical protein
MAGPNLYKTVLRDAPPAACNWRANFRAMTGDVGNFRLSTALRFLLHELGPFQVPIVPTSVKAPVAESMPYMETSFEAEFVT